MRRLVLSLSSCLAVAACGASGDDDTGDLTEVGGPSPATGEPSATGGPASSDPATDPASSAPATATDAPSSASEVSETCGDGVVDPPEICDFGPYNADDGACTLACEFARCGDGLIYAGVEACDDANQIDNDGCPNDCVPGGCGNGFVEQGEQCDDGNLDDDDACLATCEDARCGDGEVQAGVETCDDGNDSDNDLCTRLCVPPTCSDAAKNGYESDIDCGGPHCGGCSLGGACLGNLDCGDGVCKQQQCVAPLPLMPPGCAPAQVSTAQAWQAVSGTCNCHKNGAGSLPFDDASSFRSSMVNVPSTMAQLDLIRPGDVDRSYLLFKLLNQQTNVVGGSGSPMPIGKVLSDAQRCAVIEWVRGGAD